MNNNLSSSPPPDYHDHNDNEAGDEREEQRSSWPLTLIPDTTLTLLCFWQQQEKWVHRLSSLFLSQWRNGCACKWSLLQKKRMVSWTRASKHCESIILRPLYHLYHVFLSRRSLNTPCFTSDHSLTFDVYFQAWKNKGSIIFGIVFHFSLFHNKRGMRIISVWLWKYVYVDIR